MKKISEEFLKEYISKHIYADVLDYDMYKIFKIYSSLEITSDSNIMQAIEDFEKFWEENKKDIECLNPKDKPELEESIKQETSLLKIFISNSRTFAAKEFADIVHTISPSKDGKILDVGSGQYPYSSISLGQSEQNVYSMDRTFYISNQSLNAMNVNPVSCYFTANTPVDEYDFVVGRFPCSAIEHIVRNCVNANKPYFLQLCSCNAPILENEPKFEWLRWRDYLSSIDPNIKFLHSYAFNIDASPKNIHAVIKSLRVKKFHHSNPSRNRDSQSLVVLNPTIEKLIDEELNK